MKMKYGYIFDFDGILVNTMELHFESYKSALEEANIPIVKKQFFSQAGMTGREQIKYFADRAGIRVDVEAVYKRKTEIAKGNTDRATSIECNIELLKILKKKNVKIAIATGSSRPSILPIMKRFDIQVDAIATSEDVERGKPHPDLFLCAAEALGIPPENCIVLEDSDVGIEAAKNAGMKALRFYNNQK
jgi:HAD superfamily hydrolase (TIGR01509 family)